MSKTTDRENAARVAWAAENHTVIVEGVVELSEGSAVGIFGSSLANVMEIAAEIVDARGAGANDPTPVVVDSDRFAVYPSGTYHPIPAVAS